MSGERQIKTVMMRSMIAPLARMHSGIMKLSKITTGCALMYGNAGLVRCLGGNSMRVFFTKSRDLESRDCATWIESFFLHKPERTSEYVQTHGAVH